MPITKEQAKNFRDFLDSRNTIHPDYSQDSNTIIDAFKVPVQHDLATFAAAFDIGREYERWAQPQAQPESAKEPEPDTNKLLDIAARLAIIEAQQQAEIAAGKSYTAQEAYDKTLEVIELLREGGDSDGADALQALNTELGRTYRVKL